MKDHGSKMGFIGQDGDTYPGVEPTRTSSQFVGEGGTPEDLILTPKYSDGTWEGRYNPPIFVDVPPIYEKLSLKPVPDNPTKSNGVDYEVRTLLRLKASWAAIQTHKPVRKVLPIRDFCTYYLGLLVNRVIPDTPRICFTGALVGWRYWLYRVFSFGAVARGRWQRYMPGEPAMIWKWNW